MLFLNTGKIHSLGQIPRKMHKFYRRRVGPRPLSPLKKKPQMFQSQFRSRGGFFNPFLLQTANLKLSDIADVANICKYEHGQRVF